MATAIGNTLMWSPHGSELLRSDRASRLSRRSSTSFLGSKRGPEAEDELRASALHLVCNCDEAMTDARVLQVVLPLTLLPLRPRVYPTPCTLYSCSSAPHVQPRVRNMHHVLLQTERGDEARPAGHGVVHAWVGQIVTFFAYSPP